MSGSEGSLGMVGDQGEVGLGPVGGWWVKV